MAQTSRLKNGIVLLCARAVMDLAAIVIVIRCCEFLSCPGAAEGHEDDRRLKAYLNGSVL